MNIYSIRKRVNPRLISEAGTSADACQQASAARSLAVKKIYDLRLKAADVFQLLDALVARAECYEKTAQYLDDGTMDEPFIIEQVDDAEEAREIAQHFRDVQEEISRQIAESRSRNS